MKREPSNRSGCRSTPVFKRKALCLSLSYGLSTTALCIAGAAIAQTAPGAPAPAVAAEPTPAGTSVPAPTEQLDAIVVTARKRTEKLQDVPLSISAFNSDTLKAAGIHTATDLAVLTPGFTISNAGSDSAIAPTIRGLSNISSGAAPNVAFFLDGVYLQNSSALSLGLIDLERIEVVKGPVSALYGRSAYAGAVNYVSKRPPAKLEGNIDLTSGSGGERAAAASIGGMLIDNMLRGRLAVSDDQFAGTHKDYQTGHRSGGHDNKDLQATAEFTPTDRLTINGMVFYGKDKFDESAVSYADNNCGPLKTGANNNNAGQFTYYCGGYTTNRPASNPDISSNAGAVGNQREALMSSVRIAYDLDWFDVSTTLGYNKIDQRRLANFFGPGLQYKLTDGTSVSLPTIFGNPNKTDDKSVELRLASKQDQRFRWSTGVYWYDSKAEVGSQSLIDGSSLKPGQTVDFSYFPSFVQYFSRTGTFNPASFLPADSTDKIVSEFISGDFDILPNLTASVEGRHTLQTKTQVTSTYNTNTQAYVPGTRYASDFAFNNYRTTLTYKVLPTNLLYGSIATGTKPGGFNTGTAIIDSEITYKPETSKSFELGSKNTFFGNRLQANLAVFQIKASNLQLTGPSDNPATLGFVVKNLGSLTSRGFELEGMVRPIRGMTVNAGVGYANAKFDAGTYDYSAVDIGVCSFQPSCASRIKTVQSPQGARTAIDLAGLQVQKASKVTLSTSVSYSAPLYGDWDYFARADANYRSRQYVNAPNASWWGSSTLVNLRAGFENEQYTTTFYVKNLTKNQVPTVVTPNSRLNDPAVGAVLAGYLPEERTFGVMLSYRF